MIIKFAKVQKMPFTEYSFFDEMQLCVEYCF